MQPTVVVGADWTLHIASRQPLERRYQQGSKFVVAMVANATMFSHLLPGCSCGSKHLLVPYILAIVNLLHDFLYNVL